MTKNPNLEEKREVLFEAVELKTGHVVYEYICPACGKTVVKVIKQRPCEHCGTVLLQYTGDGTKEY